MEPAIHTIPVTALRSLTLTEEDLDKFISERQAQGVVNSSAAKYRSYLNRLCRWLPEGKLLTRELLLQWRAELEESGYSKATVEKYVTYANLYTKHCGHPEMNIKKSKAYQLSGRQFGSLTAIKPTGRRSRTDVLWLCRCRCGKELEVPAGLLVRGNTASCGCLAVDILNYHNRYVAGTELRKSLADRPISTKAASGYTGVTSQRGKWVAYITYQKKHYHLGCYSELEDAVNARAKAKAAVIQDAKRLYSETEHLYAIKPEKPPRPPKRVGRASEDKQLPHSRTDNTSGCTGVTAKNGKWLVRITVRGIRYPLGIYERLEQAVTVRRQAEAYLLANQPEKIAAMSRQLQNSRTKEGE